MNLQKENFPPNRLYIISIYIPDLDSGPSTFESAEKGVQRIT